MISSSVQESKGVSFFEYLGWISGHVVLFLVLFFSLRSFIGLPPIPSGDDLWIFDTQYYYAIGQEGYSYDPSHGSNVAFFPAFAWLWKATGLYTQGIAVINILIYIFSLSWLANSFRFTIRETLLFASLPSMIFMYVAYSEPLFFLTFTILLIGLKNEKIAVVAAGIFLCSVTRSSVNVFIPAIIIMQWIGSGERKWLKMWVYLAAALAGIALVSYIQYLQTGEALGFIKTQKYWEHKLQWPRLPMWTWGGTEAHPEKEVLWLDSYALVAGVASMVLCTYYFLQKIRNKVVKIENYILFSLLYLAGLTLLSLAMKGGGLFSLNRYLIPGAAFAVLFSRLLRIRFTSQQLWQIFGLVLLVLTLTHFFRHIRLILLSFAVLAYIALILLYHRDKFRKPAFIAMYIIGMALKLYLLTAFINCDWVG